MESTAGACPWCQAPRGSGPSCPKCGANYAKAEAIKQGRAAPVAATATATATAAAAAQVVAMPEGDSLAGLPGVDDPELEWKFCVGALPVMLVIGIAFHFLAPFLQRTFLAMPVHELGHAATAWLCGYFAIPTLWKTLVPDERGFVAPLLLAGGMGWMMFRAWQNEKPGLVALGAGVLLLAAIGTLGLKFKTTQMLIVFGGDGMGMVIATALMGTFFFGKDTQLYRGSLRWGFLAIGAAGFVDMFGTWVAARRDYGAIPFGEQEGGLLSDATRLVDDFGWTADQLINRYVGLGVCCLIALMLVYAWGVRQAWVSKNSTPAR